MREASFSFLDFGGLSMKYIHQWRARIRYFNPIVKNFHDWSSPRYI